MEFYRIDLGAIFGEKMIELMRFRKLRIASSVVCGIACVLLIALWVRSYSTPDIYEPFGHVISVAVGTLIMDETWVLSTEPPLTTIEALGPDAVRIATCQTLVPAGDGVTMPIWLPTTGFLVVGTIPWLPRRFTLRTLLIATTLVAVVLGLAVYATRN